MRMKTKGGVTPCDRRLDRRKVAIAAAAVLFLSATSARANIVEFEINMDLSHMKQTSKIVGPAVGGSQTSSPQSLSSGPYGEASDKTHYFGSIYVDIQPTTIQIMTGSRANAVYTGVYAPHDPVISDPVGPPPVGADPGQYGLQIPTLGLFANQYNIALDMGYAGDPGEPPTNTATHDPHPSAPLPLAGNNFDLSGQAMSFLDGRQAFVSGLGNDTGNLTGGLFVYFGSAGADIGTWDEGTQTLTLPIHSTYSFRVTDDFGGIDQFLSLTGQIVATPKVPEPTTLTLFGFGLAGLLSYAWRARKRRALVA